MEAAGAAVDLLFCPDVLWRFLAGAIGLRRGSLTKSPKEAKSPKNGSFAQIACRAGNYSTLRNASSACCHPRKNHSEKLTALISKCPSQLLETGSAEKHCKIKTCFWKWIVSDSLLSFLHILELTWGRWQWWRWQWWWWWWWWRWWWWWWRWWWWWWWWNDDEMMVSGKLFEPPFAVALNARKSQPHGNPRSMASWNPVDSNLSRSL